MVNFRKTKKTLKPDSLGANGQSSKQPAVLEVLDNTLRVTTPENISFEYKLAGPFRRIMAYFVDVLISVVCYFIVAGLIFLLVTFAIMPLLQSAGLSSLGEAILGLMFGMVLIGYFIVYWFYGALMETYYNGQTIGKRWTQLRVLSTNGHSIDAVQAILRNFFRFLDIVPFVSIGALFQVEELEGGGFPTCLFALLIMTLSRKYQRIGDIVADTVVISESSKRPPQLAVFTDPRVPGLAELIPNSFVVPASMSKAIAEYADQRRFLPTGRQSEIAAYLAAPLLEKFAMLPDTDHDLFICALYYKTFMTAETDDTPMVLTPRGEAVPAAVSGAPVAAAVANVANEQEVLYPGLPNVFKPTQLPDDFRPER